MMLPSKPKKSWLTLLGLIAALVIWTYDHAPQKNHSSQPNSPPASASKRTAPLEKTGNYECYRGCTLAAAANNDGDSFLLQLPDGRRQVFRLYFIDTPESAFRSYANGETNHSRIRQQAAEMGGITPAQAVAIGQQAKHFTLALLASHPFDIYTRWDSPFKDQRFHAFIAVKQAGQSRWLEELLIERGLARLKTKTADLPDGTPAAKQLAHLKDLEQNAQSTRVGVWGL